MEQGLGISKFFGIMETEDERTLSMCSGDQNQLTRTGVGGNDLLNEGDRVFPFAY